MKDTEKVKTNKEKKELSWKSRNWITAVCTVIIILSIGAFLIITADMVLRDKGEFSYQDAMGDTVVTVGTEEVTLKEIMYYILVAESNYNGAAQIYNEDNLNAFWNINLNFRFLKDLSKDSIMDACIRDQVYYQEALKAGYTLSEEEEEEISDRALEEMDKMTEDQIRYTEYRKQDMVRVLTKIQYAGKYVSHLMEGGYTEKQLDSGGEKYEEIAQQYKTEINKKIWNQVTIGKMTINRDYE